MLNAPPPPESRLVPKTFIMRQARGRESLMPSTLRRHRLRLIQLWAPGVYDVFKTRKTSEQEPLIGSLCRLWSSLFLANL